MYVVGGSSESSRLSSAERYDVSCDQWSSLPEMSVARNGVGVIVAGGIVVCGSFVCILIAHNMDSIGN